MRGNCDVYAASVNYPEIYVARLTGIIATTLAFIKTSVLHIINKIGTTSADFRPAFGTLHNQ